MFVSLSVYLSANFAETACLNELCKIGTLYLDLGILDTLNSKDISF